ncbi:hypothetical protein HHK36_006842 [Tetracentron sinense]|uniref:R13L1/DRL21-like LRR repeat region domain-containing protein n=1 Tax=Tetracentron sinense TaxID=13715 RepID=A0A834ZSF8_TETSI|nr:hypothetical protein HHK36_006842 [Tetracentron sinense]
MEEGGAKLGEMKDLNKLGESFHIKGLENVINADEAKDAALKYKQYFKELRLEWGDGDRNLRELSLEELVLESLEPHTNLESLGISGSYGGARFPKWMEDESFSKLKSITLEGDGECCQVLPALGQLPLLIDLRISRVLGLKHIGREFYGMGKGFPSLETLVLENLPELAEWFEVEEDGEFLCLRELTIAYCPKLRKLPDAFRALKKLTLKSFEGPVILPRFPALCDLALNRRNSGCIDKKLWSTSMDVWLLFSALGLKSLFCHRSFMFINDMVALNESFSPMNTYVVSDFEESTTFPEEFPGALHAQCPAASSSLMETRRGSLTTMLERLEISEFSKLEALSLQDFTSLETLEICACPKLNVTGPALVDTIAVQTLAMYEPKNTEDSVCTQRIPAAHISTGDEVKLDLSSTIISQVQESFFYWNYGN